MVTMEKQTQIIALFLGVAVTATALGLYFRARAQADAAAKNHSELVATTAADGCSAQDDITGNIEKLSDDTVEASEPVQRLLSTAESSPQCRTTVIQELVRAMNKPHANLQTDRASFLLWSKGSAILGKLKAVEALDILIEHSNLSDGLFSASMSHQPAIAGIIAMGNAAVPKLADALKLNPRREIRLNAALCLSEIGGQEATDALRQALPNESDQCAKRFIELLLAPPTADVLQQRLLAYRCGN
jgi:HEAT repeat protein